MTRRAKRRLTILITVSVGTAGLATGAYVVREAAQHRAALAGLDSGREAYERGDFEAALSGIGRYVARNKGDVEALILLAEARRRVPVINSRHLGQAASIAKVAAAAAPADPRPLEILLELYGAMRFTNERLATADALLALDPEHAGAMQARVQGLAELGRTADALAVATALAELNPRDPEPHRQVIALMLMQDRPRDEVKAYVEATTEQAPDSLSVALLHSTVLASLGDLDAARAVARAATELSPTDAKEILATVDLLDRLGLDSEAAAFLTSAAEQPSLGIQVAAVRAQRAWKAGNRAAARAAAAEAIVVPESLPDDALGWSLLALSEDPSTATGAAAALADLRSRPTAAESGWTAAVEAALMIGEDKPAAAVRLLEKSGPTECPARPYLLGDALIQQGEWRRGANVWTALLASDPFWRLARLRLANVLLANRQLPQALEHATKAVELQPNAAEAFTLAEVSLAVLEAGLPGLVEPAAVRTLLEQLNTALPNDARPPVMLARLELRRDAAASAEAYTKAAIERSSPGDPSGLIALAESWRASRPDLADQLIDKARVVAPDHPATIIAVAVKEAREHGNDAGERIIREAMASAGEGGAARLAPMLARFLDQAGSPAAKDELTSLASARPHDASAQLQLLESRSAWTDELVVSRAINALRAITGDYGLQWRRYEARRLLEFNPTAQRAAEALQVLTPAIQGTDALVQDLALGVVAWNLLGDRARAIELLERAVASQPSSTGLQLELVGLLQTAGRTVDAKRRLEVLLSHTDLPATSRRTRAHLLRAQGMHEEALRDYEALIPEQNPADLLPAAQLSVQLGRIQQASSAYEQLLALPAPTGEAVVSAANFYAAAGELDRAMALFGRLPADSPPEQRAAAMSSLLERFGRQQEAERLLRELAADGNPTGSVLLARLLMRRGDPAAAGRVVEDALAQHPGNAELLDLQSAARVLASDGTDTESFEKLVTSLDSPDVPEPVRRLALILRQYGTHPAKQADLIRELRNLTADHPNVGMAWTQLIVALQNAGRSEEAIRATSEAAAVLPNDPRPLQLATDLLAMAGRLDEARTAAAEWRRRSGDPMAPDLAIARLDAARGRFVEGLARAMPYRERMIAAGASDGESLGVLASLLVGAGRPDEANALLWDLAQSSRPWALTYLQTAMRIPDPEQRRTWIRRISPRLATDPDGHLALAASWATVARTGGAAPDLTEAVTLLDPLWRAGDPNTAAAAMAGECYQQLGQFDEAEAAFRAALAGDRENSLVLNNLAFMLADQNRKPTEAAQLATEAVRLERARSPSSQLLPSFLDTLGTAMLAAGRADEAVAAMREAVALDPTRSRTAIRLCEALLQFHRPEEARVVLHGVMARPIEDVTLRRRVEQIQSELSATP